MFPDSSFSEESRNLDCNWAKFWGEESDLEDTYTRDLGLFCLLRLVCTKEDASDWDLEAS